MSHGEGGGAGADRRAVLIDELVALGRAAWPGVPITRAQVDTHLARLEAPPPADTLRRHAADLCLAAACAAGVAEAPAALERAAFREIGDFVARIDASPVFAGEVQQAVREKLLLPAAGRPGKIAEYSGRGPLGGWIRVVAVRTAFDLRRARGHDEVDSSDADRVAALTLDPETALLRERHRVPFQEALEAALGALTPRERNLLRLHFAEGWTLEQLATSYSAHRATIARWLAAAREALVAGVARRLGDALGMTAGEVASVVRLLGSQIDVSLSRLS